MSLKDSAVSPATPEKKGLLSPVLLYTAGSIWMAMAGVLLIPLAVSLAQPAGTVEGHFSQSLSFGAVIAMAFISGAGAVYFSRDKAFTTRIAASDGAIIAAICWITVGFMASLPYYFSGWIQGFENCFFEGISGITTTGASVVADPSIMPSGILLWRSMTQWLGGMGIIVLFVAVLPAIGESSHSLFHSEIPGGANFKKATPRIRSTARALWIIYLVLTVAETLMLWAAGLTFFDALLHAFTTIATGGFSTFSDSNVSFNVTIHWIVIIFMAIAGMNFTLHFRMARGEGLKTYFGSSEFKVYMGLLTLTGTLLTLDLLLTSDMPGTTYSYAITHGFFQSTSILTTTGYMSADFGSWSQFAQSILFMLMFVGGCSGSTSGGFKVIRHVLIFKAVEGELKRMANPRRVTAIRLDGEVINESLYTNALAFLALFMAVFGVSGIALTMMGMDMVSAFSASVACLGNVGPGLGTVGPATTYMGVPAVGKYILCAEMLLGRLELFGLVLFIMMMARGNK